MERRAPSPVLRQRGGRARTPGSPSASWLADVVTFLSPLPRHLKYRVLLEPLAVCRFASDARVPAWALEGGFFCVVRTRDELSIVCDEAACTEDICRQDRMPAAALAERRWPLTKLE